VSKAARLVAAGTGVAFGVALIVYYVVSYLMVTPPGVAASGSKPRVHLTLQTVASFGNAPHPDWVSYLARNPSGKWIHSTVLHVPSYSTVTVTIYQFDTATVWGKETRFSCRVGAVFGPLCCAARVKSLAALRESGPWLLLAGRVRAADAVDPPNRSCV
jgi:hypothetical protein